ncbi:PREDICTED: polyadenylate-binding protein-interacting protein 7-like [Ipomoea nil]|uniref:polyadenylate-binding protein-interacting protein 7-like n=1 Tax=Ipomoea nil TaxID=35883 RepID=UPI000901F8FD|nr:PREDICTED: polyadenylate-binding protein-interacting protein 7-like [Ipomoea nil]
MSFLGKGIPTGDRDHSSAKATTLNPNAAEFIPFALRSPSGNTSNTDASKFADVNTSTLGKSVLDRSESSVSNNSDDEVRRYWRCRLPDDITTDFEVMGEDDDHGISSLPFSNLSLTDITNTSRFPTSTGSAFMLKEQQRLSPNQINGTSFDEKTSYLASRFAEDASSTSFHLLPGNHWEKQHLNNNEFLANVREAPPYDVNSRHEFLTDVINEQQFVEDIGINPVEFLASKFPGFAAESLAEVYYANGGDLNLTVEMLSQLEQQVDSELNQNLNSKAVPAPNLSALDFPALSVADNENSLLTYSGDDLQQEFSPYRESGKDSTLAFKSGSSLPYRGTLDFASAVKKMASQDSSMWKYDKHGSNDARVGSSRNSHVLASPYNGSQSRAVYGDRLHSRGSTRAAPAWLETGEAVANMYSEMREEARDHARLRNAYFEQARQAYLSGQKALAKELSEKGQLHNMKMKDAHGRAQESIFRVRNQEVSTNGRGQERIIDLHGLHVSEGIQVLKRELAVLRNAARSADQRLQVFICVGTGHHTKGSRTPARLPTAIQRYLLEEEGLDYSEPQPGLLRVVVY